ncbi:MAG TPA: serine/threonine-protein kinase [Planctomycetota bacterium]|nr:serine/threonine-protein kinase [Planctomycetota bacterium]HQB00062.1 serine/threonine-protein kinase [Planctomycetota bacterium]
MNSKQELILGKQAVAKKYITRDQLRACLELQVQTKTPLLLIFLEKHIISEPHINNLLQHHFKRKELLSPGEDLCLCQILIREELISEEELAEIIQNQQEQSIAEFFFQQKHLPLYEFLQIYTQTHNEIIFCLGCQKAFRLANLTPGKRVRCKYCKEIIQIPTLLDVVSTDKDIEIETPHTEEEHFAGYEIIEEIAQGGMGIIYRAQKQATGQIVALKVLREAFRTSPEAKKRFAREAQTLSRLKHPHIVQIFDVGIENEIPYFSMEFVDGSPLSDYIEEPNLLPIPQVVDIVLKMAQSLYYAHQAEVIHRDIKPSNILLDKSGEPRLTDFGLAKCMDSMTLVTRSGTTLGSPYYMSPEQAKGQLGLVSPRSDIYSLGVVFYELLTGVNPFKAENTVDIYQKILTVDPPAPSTVRKEIPKKLDSICLKCLKKDSFLRYKNAQFLVNDIIQYKEGKQDSWFQALWKKIFKR